MTLEERITQLEKELAEIKVELESRPTKEEITTIVIGDIQHEIVERLEKIKFVAPDC